MVRIIRAPIILNLVLMVILSLILTILTILTILIIPAMWRPVRMSSSVLFPAPLGPITANIPRLEGDPPPPW
jgi:uncharacterized membrane protein YqjE